jgi:hypothetical protein
MRRLLHELSKRKRKIHSPSIALSYTRSRRCICSWCLFCLLEQDRSEGYKDSLRGGIERARRESRDERIRRHVIFAAYAVLLWRNPIAVGASVVQSC